MTRDWWRNLSFGAPDRLWWLLALAAAGVAVAGLAVARSRNREAYAQPALRPSAAPRRPGWRRWVSGALLGLAVVALTTAFARPQVPGKESSRRSVVMVAIDTSGSMALDDVSPDRLTAAKVRAKAFIDALPADIDAGVIAISTTARMVAPPTSDHAEVAAAVDSLQVEGYTAIGDSIALAVSAAEQDLGGSSSDGSAGSAARIVLLSDGANSRGRSVEDGITTAVNAGIPVSTIALGSESGVGKDKKGRVTTAKVDTAALEQIAQQTGGNYYRATGSGALAEVYRDIGSHLVTRPAPNDVSDVLAGIGLVLLLGSAVPALLWSGRLTP
jgi:Ca-activated chloride channel family protein